MNWIETLGPSRPQLLAGRRFRGSMAPSELSAIFDALESDEACAGHRTNLDLQTLCRCLYAAAKMESEGAPECRESAEFHELYAELFSFLEASLTEFPCLRRSPGAAEVLLYCLGSLVDLAKFVLRSIDESSPPARTRDAVFLVRTLCRALDRDLPFHQQHEHSTLPAGLLDATFDQEDAFVMDIHRNDSLRSAAVAKFGTVVLPKGLDGMSATGTSTPTSTFAAAAPSGRGAPVLQGTAASSADAPNADQRRTFCGSNAWWSTLDAVVQVGYEDDSRGFDILKRLLPRLHRLPLDLTEVVLHLFACTSTYLRADLRSNLLVPCMDLMRGLSARCTSELDPASLEVFVVILKHLKPLLQFLLPADMARALAQDLQCRVLELVVGVAAPETAHAAPLPTRHFAPRREHQPRLPILPNEPTTKASSSLWCVIGNCLAWVRSPSGPPVAWFCQRRRTTSWPPTSASRPASLRLNSTTDRKGSAESAL